MTQKEKRREKNSMIMLKALKLQNEFNQKHTTSTLIWKEPEIFFCIIIPPPLCCIIFISIKAYFNITHIEKGREERKNPHLTLFSLQVFPLLYQNSYNYCFNFMSFKPRLTCYQAFYYHFTEAFPFEFLSNLYSFY